VAQDVRWLMGTVWTVLGALVVFVITQSVLLLVMEPVQEQRRLIGEVASALTVYQKSYTLRVQPSDGTEPKYYGVTREEAMEADRALRELAGRLRASLWSVPAYDLFGLLHILPKSADVAVAAKELSMWYSQLPVVNEHQVARIQECQATISKRLGIERRLQALSAPPTPSEETHPPTVR
jgi:hypothetical protein